MQTPCSHREKGTAINLEKHHHTVFSLDGITVENHYDFLNVHAHASNREIEKKLQELAAEPEKKVLLGEAPLYLPSVDFNALFLLRHTAGHFAAEKIGLRHLIDWTMFIDRHSEEIDWTALKLIVYKMNMHRFLRTLCALSIDYLGLDESKIPPFERDAQLEERVMNELLHPEFSEKSPQRQHFHHSTLQVPPLVGQSLEAPDRLPRKPAEQFLPIFLVASLKTEIH